MINGNGHANGVKPAPTNAAEHFISPSRGERDFFQMADDIIEFISEDERSKYTVVVGTDSEQFTLPVTNGKLGNGSAMGLAEFVSVIVVHRIGKHGRYFWKRVRGIKTFDRHDRILKEASYSLELAQKIITELRARLREHLYDFEIHLDIGTNGPTKNMIQEIVGMITGSGFTARIKPDSYAANKVADRHVHPSKNKLAQTII